MKKVILESELPSTDIRHYEEVLAVKSVDSTDGIGVWQVKKMADFYRAETEARVTERTQLLIVVPDPDDEETIDRLRQACAVAWGAKP